MYKQIIIARKDLNMSPGKLAARLVMGAWHFCQWQFEELLTKHLLRNILVWLS